MYAALEELEIIAIRKNLKTKVIQKTLDSSSITFTSRHKKRTIHCSIYSPAFWQIYEVYTQEITYIKNMFGCDQKGNSNLIVADFLHKSSQYTQNAMSFYTDVSKNPEGAVGAGGFFLSRCYRELHHLFYQAGLLWKQREIILFWVPAHSDRLIPRKRSYKFNPSRQRWIYIHQRFVYEDFLSRRVTPQFKRWKRFPPPRVQYIMSGTTRQENLVSRNLPFQRDSCAWIASGPIILILMRASVGLTWIDSPACPCEDP